MGDAAVVVTMLAAGAHEAAGTPSTSCSRTDTDASACVASCEGSMGSAKGSGEGAGMVPTATPHLDPIGCTMRWVPWGTADGGRNGRSLKADSVTGRGGVVDVCTI